ncbi:MAG: YdcF family protein [Alphaproteobacteria bacterium]|nr:YdcF family protein [Alphaproteobacteria bacterium]
MYSLIKALALPPANFVLVIVLGLILRRWMPRAGLFVAVAGAVVLYGLSTSFVATRLLAAVESGIVLPVLPVDSKDRPGAVVVLAAGFVYETPGEAPQNVDSMTLERLRQGARLHQESGLPMLVTGGWSRNNQIELAIMMQRTLRQDFGVEPIWIEKQSRTTHENAVFSARILKSRGIRSVYLVSQAWHLPRAVAAFEAAGLSVTAAPSSFVHPSRIEVNAFLPAAKALRRSYFAMHEFFGLAWYRWTLTEQPPVHPQIIVCHYSAILGVYHGSVLKLGSIRGNTIDHRPDHAVNAAIAFSSNFNPSPGLSDNTSSPFSIGGVSS